MPVCVVGENQATVGREQRDDVFDPVYERMNQYRQVVQGQYPKGHGGWKTCEGGGKCATVVRPLPMSRIFFVLRASCPKA